jgi:hypothetical protein
MGADRHPSGDEHGAQPRGSSNVPASASSRMTRDVNEPETQCKTQPATDSPVAARRATALSSAATVIEDSIRSLIE